MVHRWTATGEVVGNPDYENHAALFADRLGKVSVDRAALWPQVGKPFYGAHEVGVAVDCVGGGLGLSFEKEKTKLDAWKMSFPDNWAVGTLDYVGAVLGVPWVDDVKTGSFLPQLDDPQFLLYALAALRTDCRQAREILVSITHWPRYPKDRPPTRSWRKFTVEQIDRFEAELRETYALHCKIKGRGLRNSDLIAGPQCQFCPSKFSCPLEPTLEM